MVDPRVNILKQPSGMYLTSRDRDVLYSIYRYDSLLSLQQIWALHFQSRRTAYERMLKLFKFGYVNHPPMKERMSLDDQVYWLTRSGAQIAAEAEGIPVESLLWLKKPRLDRIRHQIPLNNFRIKLEQEVKDNPDLQLQNWWGQVPMTQKFDRVSYINYFGKPDKKYIEPDGLFVIYNSRTDYPLRALLELDRGTKDNLKVINEKVLPYLEYFNSDFFQFRTNETGGRVLFVVQSGNSELRLAHLKAAIEKAVGNNAKHFWFTTYEAAMNAQSIMFDPIWVLGTEQSLKRLTVPVRRDMV